VLAALSAALATTAQSLSCSLTLSRLILSRLTLAHRPGGRLHTLPPTLSLRATLGLGVRKGSAWLARLWRLRWVGAEEPVLERSAVETADDGLHLVVVGGVDEGEALRLLCFRVSDHLDLVGHKAFRGQPGLDVVSGDPDG
jgi:hypothetical protein